MRETGYYLIREEFTTVEIAYWDATKLKWLSLHGSFMHEGVPFKEIIKSYYKVTKKYSGKIIIMQKILIMNLIFKI